MINQISKVFAPIIFLMSASAFAAEDSTENAANPDATSDQNWTMATIEKKNGEAWGSALITISEDGREVGFRCWDGKLLAAFALDENDLLTAFTAAGPQKAVRLDVSINGGEPETQSWMMLRRHKVVASGDQKMTRRIYNAVVRGESVTIDARRRGGEYIMPPPDPEVFASFMETCGFSAKQS